MMDPRQQMTVASDVVFAGRGLHTGRQANVRIRPAEADTGLVFIHCGRSKRTEIKATWTNVRHLPLSTCLSAGGRTQIRTVEHLLAACYATGLDNALIEVQGREIPIFDGSATPIIRLLEQAGLRPLDTTRPQIRVLKKVTVKEGVRSINLHPATSFSMDIGMKMPVFGAMRWRGEMTRPVFAREIAPARTFGKLSHGVAAKLSTFFWKDPICLGAGPDSAVVIFRGRVINRGGLRFPDEFVRHRVLDLAGDLMLAGADIIGRVSAFATTHRLNAMLLAALFNDRTAWEMVEDRAAASVTA
jgi:UDP-3-O-[3-hydroxymyristoyl] N-acetylglucosamine deacetylase